MIGQNRHNWPDFFLSRNIFEVFGKGLVRVHYLSNKFSKIAKLGTFRPQRLLTFNISNLKFRDLAK